MTSRPWPKGHCFSGRSLPAGPNAFSFLLVQERKHFAKERRRQRKPFGRVFSGLFPKLKGRGPSDSSGVLGLRCSTNRACLQISEHSRSFSDAVPVWPIQQNPPAEQQIFGLVPAKSKFPLEISLRWGLRWCSEVFRSPPQLLHKDFCRAKVPCDGKRPKVCCSAARSLKIDQTGTQKQTRKRVLTFFVSTLCFLCTNCREPPRSLRGRGPSVWERVQRKPFRRVFFGVFFLLLSIFFLARARKKMRLDQLAGFCQNQNGACRRARQPKLPTLLPASCKLQRYNPPRAAADRTR